MPVGFFLHSFNVDFTVVVPTYSWLRPVMLYVDRNLIQFIRHEGGEGRRYGGVGEGGYAELLALAYTLTTTRTTAVKEAAKSDVQSRLCI